MKQLAPPDWKFALLLAASITANSAVVFTILRWLA
jgi:hypothetical protein